MPFAYDSCGVVVLFQIFRQSDFTAFDAVFRGIVYYARYSYTLGVTSGEQGGTGRGGSGCSGVEIGETGSFGSQSVQVGSLQVRTAITFHVAVSLVVGQQDYDIGLAGGFVICVSALGLRCFGAGAG